MIDTVKAWLKTYPGWTDCAWYVDYLDVVPGCVGIFPQGCRQLWEQTDIRGVRKVRQKWQFVLYPMGCDIPDREQAAREVTAFQQWIQQTQAPVFGEDQKISAQKGHLFQLRQPGMCVYSVRLDIEFTKLYEVI